ncbi:hypothetical protein Tco_1182372 [Tanacetum coccineum]
MTILESCPKHNIVAYLEKTDGNTEFHEIISFLTRSSIYYALTVSPVVSTIFVEQFWLSAKFKLINNVRYITAKVAGKPVSISEASIRSDLIFNNADRIDSLPNQAIFDAIQLMGYGYIKNYKKTVKNGQARTRESEEFKKKPKIQSRSQKSQASKPLVKDEEASDVDVPLYRSMIGSLMYLTASRPDIMFAICACSRFQVTPKTSHLYVVKRIFRYLKGKPKLGLWYPRVSSFDLEAYSDSDYVGANLNRKSTTGGCQFLGKRLISWQCKKQTIVATSTTKVEYVAVVYCCGQVLWIQNQMLDYGFNFMNTKIYIDNESTTCIVKNPVFYSKTKHIAIRHHFIRDAYEKKLIQVQKIHTDNNVADLLTKAFDVSGFQFLVVTIRMINP